MEWTPFKLAAYEPHIEEMLRKSNLMPDEVHRNNLFEVQVRKMAPREASGWPAMVWLSIKRIDKEPLDENHWRTLQRIKNELVGPECEGVELFPAESRLVDTSNQYHLWVLDNTDARFPFGFMERLVGEISVHGSKQRPWDDDTRPSDLQNEALERAMGDVKAGRSTLADADARLRGGE